MLRKVKLWQVSKRMQRMILGWCLLLVITLLGLSGCGSEVTPTAIAPSAPSPGSPLTPTSPTSGLVENGVLTLSAPLTGPAASVQLAIATPAPGQPDLPSRFVVPGATPITYAALPDPITPGFTTYIALLADAFTPLNGLTDLPLPEVASGTAVAITPIPMAPVALYRDPDHENAFADFGAVFEGNAGEVTLADVALTLAVVNLGDAAQGTSLSLANTANNLLGGSQILPSQINPLPTPLRVDFAASDPPAGLQDVAVVLATANLPSDQRQPGAIASTASTLLGQAGAIAPGDIRAVPGQSLPATQVASNFNIDLRFISDVITPSQQQGFRNAANRWTQLIVGDIPSVTVNAGQNACIDGVPAVGQEVDDLLIDIGAVVIDGPGGALAQAGPCLRRVDSPFFPAYGIVLFDRDDLSRVEQEGRLVPIVVHEMAHVLGFGTSWGRLDLVTGTGTLNPRYRGNTQAQRQNQLFGSSETTIPVENIGGSGSRDTHWRDATFDTELMTSRIGAGSTRLSSMSVAQMQDLGYQVDFNNVDAYVIPGGRSQPSVADEFDMVLDLPQRFIAPDGTVVEQP